MDHFPRNRNGPSTSSHTVSFLTRNQPPSADPARFPNEPHQDVVDKPDSNIAFMKGPKRKRLAKACDACHKSKRRCDGTAPCSNCYFASKKCTYTDASGKPVPAPRPRPEGSADGRPVIYPHPDGPPSNQPPTYGSLLPQSGEGTHVLDPDDDRVPGARKRLRPDLNFLIPSGTPPRPMGPPLLPASDRPLERDPAFTRELVHLFFAYRQPQRLIIHQPTFLAALTQGAVPPYLLLAICALAAPLSRQPRLRTSPPRYAGERFAQEALALMFDKNRNLICEHNLATAQALCLLQLHDRASKSLWATQYHQLALDIVTKLGIFEPDHTVFTPLPSTEFINSLIEPLFKRNIIATEAQLNLRLPMDETNFELSPQTAVPEYMTRPFSQPIHSEVGQLIQIASLFQQIEKAMDDFNNRENGRHPANKLLDLEKQVISWAEALPDQLRFTDENLWVQVNIYETASNMGAWCFGAMHSLHNSCVLALNWARQRCRTAMPHDISAAQEKLHRIKSVWGVKVKLSILLALILWPLFKYTEDRSQALLEWSSDFEELWGVRMQDLCSISSDSRQKLFAISHPTAPPASSAAPRVHPSPSSGAAPGLGEPGPGPGVTWPNGPEPMPSVATPLQPAFLLQVRAALDPRVRGPAQSQAQAQAQCPPPSCHPVDPREKEGNCTDPSLQPGVSGAALQPNIRHSTTTTPQHPVAPPPPSLPSLKASGLLEWPLSGSADAAGAAPPQSAGLGPAGWSAGTQHFAPPRAARASQPQQAESAMSPKGTASGPSGMPVGLQWLAHE